jgi:hypothetical protein
VLNELVGTAKAFLDDNNYDLTKVFEDERFIHKSNDSHF